MSPLPTDPQAPIRRTMPLLAISSIAAGCVIITFGLHVQAPLGPSAVWTGILDSAQTRPAPMSSAPGSASPTSSLTLYFRHAPGSHVARLPPASPGLPASIKGGDTLQVVLGFGKQHETPLALGIIQNGSVLLDTAMVLRAQLRRSARTTLGGTIVALIGVIGIFRRKQAPAPTCGA